MRQNLITIISSVNSLLSYLFLSFFFSSKDWLFKGSVEKIVYSFRSNLWCCLVFSIILYNIFFFNCQPVVMNWKYFRNKRVNFLESYDDWTGTYQINSRGKNSLQKLLNWFNTINKPFNPPNEMACAESFFRFFSIRFYQNCEGVLNGSNCKGISWFILTESNIVREQVHSHPAF